MDTGQSNILSTQKFIQFSSLFNRIILSVYKRLFRPYSTSEDDIRKERILTVVLFCICSFLLFLELSVILTRVRWGEEYTGIPIGLFTIFTITFLILYYICRIGYFKIAS